MYHPSEGEEKIIAPYQIVREIHDKAEHIEVEIAQAIRDIAGVAEEARSNLEPVIKRLDTDEVYPEVCAVDGGNSRGVIKAGWFFGTHGAVLLSNNNPLKVQGDIVSCPASLGEMTRYLQLCRDRDQLDLSTSSTKEANDDCVLFFDGSSVPLGWYTVQIVGLPNSFKGHNRHPSYENLVEDVYFGEDGTYNRFFVELTRNIVVFVPKTSVSSYFIQHRMEHYKIPKGTPDVILLSRVLRENEYLKPIEYHFGVSREDFYHYVSESGWATKFKENSDQILITYFKPTPMSPAFKVEFPRSKQGELGKILATFKRYYSPTARQFIPLLLADRLAKVFSSLAKPVVEVARTKVIQMLTAEGDRELIEFYFKG